MANYRQALFTTDTAGDASTVSMWNTQSGTAVATFKGPVDAVSRTLCIVGTDYLLAAVRDKNLINLWSLQQTDQVQQKIVCAGQVTALVTTSDWAYCIGAIDSHIHIWQVGSGQLLAKLGKHYQPITCLHVSSDNSHFVSAGKDGLVLVWSIARCVSGQQSGDGAAVNSQVPRHTWTHALPVTDVYMGCGGLSARVVTASLDLTVKVWELVSGQLLASVIFDVPISSVTMDHTDTRLFAGSTRGPIYYVNCLEQLSKPELHFESVARKEDYIFQGHSKQVTCLAVTEDSSQLISGSDDHNVHVWHVNSRQCIRTISHKGPVTNVLLVTLPVDILETSRTLQPFQHFKRKVMVASEQPASGHLLPTLLTPHKTMVISRLASDVRRQLENSVQHEQQQCDLSEGSECVDTVDSLKRQIVELKTVNKQLYQFARTQLVNVDNSMA